MLKEQKGFVVPANLDHSVKVQPKKGVDNSVKVLPLRQGRFGEETVPVDKVAEEEGHRGQDVFLLQTTEKMWDFQ